jgi:hypothetical protein
MLGVQGLAVGSISDLGRTVDIDVRLILLSSNATLVGSSATVVKDEAVSGLLARGRAVGDPGMALRPGTADPAAPSEIYQKSGTLRLRVPVPIEDDIR